jgi:hypothetical protein
MSTPNTSERQAPGLFVPPASQVQQPGQPQVPIQDRNQAFTEGAVHGSAGLEQQQANYARNAPRAFAPDSLQMQYAPSANGLGQSDASRRLPMGAAVLGTSNGQSTSSYQQSMQRWRVPLSNAPA